MDILHLKLSENKAKAVGKLLANETATSIMDLIRDKAQSESFIAKKLGIPLSTVHHNIKKLKEAGLVKSDEFTYSEKGKQVRHYKLASEQIIISTRPFVNTPSIAAGVILSAFVAVWFLVDNSMSKVVPTATKEVAEEAAFDTANIALSSARAAPVVNEPSIWPFILLGASAMLAGILVMAYIQRYRS